MADASTLAELLDRRGTVAHLVGIGGAGMAPLAAMLRDRGWRISGCDLGISAATEALAASGVDVKRGHDSSHVVGAEVVIASSAVPADSPELTAARSEGAAVVKRAEMVGALTRRSRAICLAGTHGKTTTTAMTAIALLGAGLDPSVLVGGAVAGIGVGGRAGGDELLVVESDEYDGSFLRFQPAVAVVTNVEADHLDYYASLDEIDAAFRSFLALVPAQGTTIVCADDAGARRVAPPGAITYGTFAEADWRIDNARTNEIDGMDFRLTSPGGESIVVRLAVPGMHNVRNAAAALAASAAVGGEIRRAAAALTEFRGAARRFELRGEARRIAVYDDYSHHPTEIRAALAAARQRTTGEVWCIFQPHTFNRTQALFGEFVAAFGDADHALLLDVYSPAGRETPIPEVSSERLVAAMRHPDARHSTNEQAVAIIVAEAKPGDFVFTMGAGDVTGLGPRILAALDAEGNVGG